MDTRTALLNSAETAARQRGFDGFSYADLARDVGIRKASIHHHFPKKADLAFTLIERYADQFTKSLEQIASVKSNAADKLRAYHALYRKALAGGSQLCLCVAMSAGRGSLAAPVLDRLNAFHQDSAEWLHRVYLEASKDGTVSGITHPEAEARATLALMEGAQLIARAAENTTGFDQATAAFLARLTETRVH